MKKNTPRLRKYFEEEIAKTLSSEFGFKNKLAIPRIEKVVINMGIGDASKNKKLLADARADMSAITGQTPSVQKARVSVASFSLRKGNPVGLKATLRGDRMYSFIDKLFNIVLPRLRDFRGVSLKSFDKNGNYSLGIFEHSVFPELEQAKAQTRGLEITIVTSTNDKPQSKRLLELLGMPFEKKE